MEIKTISKYEQQAIDFLTLTETVFYAERKAFGKYFSDDKEERDIYEITLTRKGKKPFVFSFGQSIRNSGTLTANYEPSNEFKRKGGFAPKNDNDFARKRKMPTAYDILTALQKYDVGSFEDFCADFGYDSDSRKAETIYHAVVKEYNEVRRLWNDKEIEQLQEIQ